MMNERAFPQVPVEMPFFSLLEKSFFSLMTRQAQHSFPSCGGYLPDGAEGGRTDSLLFYDIFMT